MSELPIIDPPRWSVRTRYHSLTRDEKLRNAQPAIKDHQLVFGDSVQKTCRGVSGESSLREMASFLNRRKLYPRDRIECAEDAPDPQKYLARITP